MFLNVLEKSVYWGQRLFAVLGVCSLVLIILIVSAGIASRYVFRSPFPWTEELATFLFIWLSFLGAGIAAARRKHVFVDYISCRFRENTLMLVRILTYIMILLFLLIIVIGSLYLQPEMVDHSSVSLNIPKNYYYLPVLIVSIYLIIVYLNELIKDIRIKFFCKE